MKKLALVFANCCITLMAMAQVPVSQEPRHHVVFKNDKVRALSVLLPPGDTTLYHLHNTPSLFVNFSKTTTSNQLLNGQPQQGTSTPGTIYFEDLSAPHTRIHRVWNVDKDTFRVMDVELLGNDTGFAEQPLELPNTQLVVASPWARAYKVTLTIAQQVTIKERSYPFLMVAVNNTTVHVVENGTEKIAPVKAGTFYWIGAAEHFTITNTGGKEGVFALFEIR